MATGNVGHIRIFRIMVPAIAFAIAAIVGSQPAEAGTYPGNKCVSSKQKEAGKYCQGVFKAWSKLEQSGTPVGPAIANALAKLQLKWGKAETKSSQKGTDCVDMTIEEATLAANIDAAVAAVDASLVGADSTCASKILGAASKLCSGYLKAESKHIKKLAKDADGATLDEKQGQADGKFSSAWANATGGGCTPAATETDVHDAVVAINDDAVTNTIVSPNVPTTWTNYDPPASVDYEGRTYTPRCIHDSDPDYYYYARRGTVNKLVMYYMGGGACWEELTCGIPVCSDSADPDGASGLNAQTTGFADLSDPSNPFKDWHQVFVTYCSCDIHFGDTVQPYAGTSYHLGFHNSRVVEKFAREHFVNPEEIFVTGSSAGAYGALFNAPLNQEVWPASKMNVLADAGNGVITSEFLTDFFPNWDFVANLPDIPGVVESIESGTGMVGYIEAITAFLPESNWAHYTTAFDGGAGGQTGFYNLMLNDNNPIAALSWWEGSCAFNSVMKQQAADTYAAVSAADDNYRYYIGTGSRHTMFGSDKVYTDTTGGVPTIVDWVNAMLASEPGDPDPGWVNVEASPFNVLLATCQGGTNAGAACDDDSECDSGDCEKDVQPATIPTPPFEMSGSDIVVVCSPGGAFLDAGSSVLD
jgi:hypothetical protein